MAAIDTDIPIKDEVQPAAVAAGPRESPKAATCHLLVIEDHADARDALAAVLRISGHRVEVAENGAQGLERASTSMPQVALVDIGLPDLDGYEVARQLRVRHGERIFLIALTGYGQPNDQLRAKDAGFDAHLVKPADFNELARLLSQVASGRARPA